MRRYLQGTLDFACGIYAVVNTLAHTHSLDLSGARYLFNETLLSLAEHPLVWKRFVRNETDHYWLVQYVLQRWCTTLPWGLSLRQPFSDCLMPRAEEPELAGAELFLPENEEPEGPSKTIAAREEAIATWEALSTWLPGRDTSACVAAPGQMPEAGSSFPEKGTGEKDTGKPKRAAIFRFHRFIPGVDYPVVSHWTTAFAFTGDILRLHDASSEKSALVAFEESLLIPASNQRALVRIVPESLMLAETNPRAPRHPYLGL